jgi:phage baseplate assembly protein W
MNSSVRSYALGYAFTGGLQLTLTGQLASCSGAEAIRGAILMLLSTIPGERVMRPDYGCDLFRLAFSPNDDTTAGLAIHYVRRAVARWEPRVEILGVDAHPDRARGEVLCIELDYRIRQTGVAERLDYAFHLGAEVA